MKLLQCTGILCALLLAGTAAGCTVSNQPLTSEPIISASSQDAPSQNSAGNADSQQQTPSGNQSAGNSSGNASNAQNADDPGTPSQQGGDADSPAQQQEPQQASSGSDYQIGSEPTLSIGVIKAQPGQKSVPVSVRISNNPGYSFGGVRLIYDKALTPQADYDEDPNGNTPIYDVGPAAGKAITECVLAPENRIVAFGMLTKEDCTADGSLFTCYFDIPADAASGTVYKLETGVERMVNANSEMLNFKLVGGEIRVQ
ncbi:MAG: hypothetical protein J5722_12595 [Oscillospiraceae bacterium]|nr:hypothetical protein [Oscillospiraceae bacterium]